MRARLLAVLLLLAPAIALTAAPATAAKSGGDSSASLGDPLFPQIGNRGYDVEHYDIALNYDPVSNSFGAGTATTITATATKDLRALSLDFQRDLTVASVTVDGAPASFDQRDAKPRFSKNPKVTQPGKLFVTTPATIPAGSRFAVDVAYSGEPKQITDADESFEGWVRACSGPDRCDGSFTVNEPIGAQSWFPCNNYATDKASISTAITVPDGYTALGTGELEARTPGSAAGTTTWSWTEDDPTATYLTSATVGRFDYDDTATLFERTGNATLPIYGAVDSAATADAKAQVAESTQKIPAMVNYLAKRFGPYPFDSVGYVADWVPSVGYALENQTKPHFAGNEKGPEVTDGELLHELAHQWMGDSVSARTWQQIWFDEGWATFAEVLYSSRGKGGGSPRKFFRAVLNSEVEQFRLAPAKLGDPANLFSGFAVYTRPAAMLEGYREIVGNKRFFRLARGLASAHAYDTIGERGFVRAAKRGSGLGPKGKRKLGRYFRQWLHRKGRPKLTPASFGGRRSGGGRGRGGRIAGERLLRATRGR